MPFRRRALSLLALASVFGASACQPAVPAAPSAPTTTIAVDSTPAPQPPLSTAPPAASQANPAAQPANPAAAPPAAQTSPTAAPTAAPKPSPTTLPTMPITTLASLPADQARAVRDARNALPAGDYTRAIGLVEPLVEQLKGDQQAEVRLIYGQALVGDRQFEKALATGETLLQSTTRADLVSAARLLKGQALRGLERYDDAAAEMRAVAESNPLVAAAVRLELEDMWLAANRSDEAAADGQKGLEVAQPRLLKIDLAEKLGTAEVALSNTDAAMDAYRQLLTAAGTKGFLGEQLYNLAVGASQLGRTDDAINALRTSISQFPRSRKAPDAVLLLEKLGGMRPQDRFYAGVIRYLFWNFRGARADFDAYLDAFPDGDQAVEARYYRGLSSPAKDTTAQLLQLAKDVPDDDFAPMALLEAGKAQEELGGYASAARIYDGLVASYPTRDAGMAGAFRRGLAHFMLGDTGGALATWDALLARDPEPSVRAEALYWSGKVLAARGDSVSAKEKFQSAAAVRPVDYYVMRAQVALDPPPASAGFDASEVQAADEAELGRWFASHGLDLAVAGQTASQDPAYIRATALVQHGLFKQANWEYEIFLTTYADKPDRLYWLAARFGEMGLPNAQLKLGTAALGGATADGQVSILEVPVALARVASPLAFPDMVTAAAKQRGFDPLLFTSLMHQESDFDPYVESVAKAKGLTQIIPQTGNEIARALGVSSFQQDDLYHPRQNVRFGAYYFSERLKRNGSVDRALASYNAGDGNVDTWTMPGRDDPDVFIEYVPFAETHDYVKKIQSYWWINRYLWAGAR
jgi:soluble lytic murein transglycosylase-like protein